LVLYYTYKQKTKIFAESFGHVLGLPIYELEADINKKSAVLFLFKALNLTFTDKTYPINNMPQDLPVEIFVCSPIWGGKLAAPVRYFLENANLQRTVVNLVLTASVPTEKYKQSALEYISKLCIPGEIFLFATNGKVKPDGEILIEQLREILGTNVAKPNNNAESIDKK